MGNRAIAVPKVTRERMARAWLLVSNDAPFGSHAISTTLDCFLNEMTHRFDARQASAIASGKTRSNLSEHRMRVRVARNFNARLSEVFVRLRMIEWMRGRFSSVTGDLSHAWNSFGALCVKDFHVDIGTLMDAVAALVIQCTGTIKSDDREKLPGWGDIADGTSTTVS